MEYRNEQKAIHGRTKPSRNPRHHSVRNLREGRAPDDLKSFHSHAGTKKAPKKSSTARIRKNFQNRTKKSRPLHSSDADQPGSSEEYLPATDSEAEGSEANRSAGKLDQSQVDKDRKSTQKQFENASPSKHIDRDHVLEIVDTKKYQEIPSYPWSENSCWLDSSLEALYCALNFHGTWVEFELLIQHEQKEPFPSPVYYLYLCLQSRRLRPISGFPESSAGIKSAELHMLRDGFRDMLFKTKMITNPGPVNTYQPALAWFASIIAPGTPYKTNAACRAFFAGVQQRLWICDHHVRVDRTTNLSAVYQAPFPETFNRYHGHMQEWLKSLTNLKGVVQGTPQEICWRKNIDQEKNYCTGKPALITFFRAIPVILTLEPNFDSLQSGMWDFPRHLYPLAKARADKNGVVYDLVARIFHNEKSEHFITRCAVPTAHSHPAIFTYDGMQFSGYSQLEKGSIDNLLAGQNPPVPSGYKTYAVLYKLRGGIEAQKYYSDHQAIHIMKKLHLELSEDTVPHYKNPEYREMDRDETALWHQSHTREYTLKTAKASSEIDSALVLQNTDMQGLVTHQSPPPNEELKTTNNGGPVKAYSELDIDHNMDSECELDHEIQTLMSSSPAPSDSAHVLCRCGVESDGHREAIAQEIVCCDDCGRYTHLACLTYRLAPRISGQFLCHICDPKITDFTNNIPPARVSQRHPHSMKTAHKHLLYVFLISF